MIHDLALYNQQRQQEARKKNSRGRGIFRSRSLALAPLGHSPALSRIAVSALLFGLQMLRAASTSSWCLLLESVAESVIFVVCG